RIAARVRDVASRRETLLNLVRKELKVKYAQSVLGAIWSLLNPIVFLAVFSFVMRITNNQFRDYPVYLLSGLLAWNLCSVSLTTGARSVIDNGNLVKKVAFPREILPLSAIGVALVDFVLQSAVLFVFTTAMTLWLAALNVRYRDIQHLLNIGLLVWFWFTPIVYSGYLVKDVLTRHPVLGVNLWNVFLGNPLTPIVMGFQRALYAVVRPIGSPKPVLPDVSLPWLAGVLAIVLVASLAFLRLTWGTFFRLS